MVLLRPRQDKHTPAKNGFGLCTAAIVPCCGVRVVLLKSRWMREFVLDTSRNFVLCVGGGDEGDLPSLFPCLQGAKDGIEARCDMILPRHEGY